MRSTRHSMASTIATPRYKIEESLNDHPNPLSDLTASESDVSDYAKRGRKRNQKPKRGKGKRAKISHSPAPTIPEMSDEDVPTEDEDTISVRPQRSTSPQNLIESPNVFRIEVNGSSGQTVIDLNLADILLSIKNRQPSISSPNSESNRVEYITGRVHDMEGLHQTGFSDLPPEIRNRIYRMVFVTNAPIEFQTRKDFSRSAAFLRTCNLVHEEGREILYGENTFCFARSEYKRGKFWERTWTEIGYKDVRRFFETIGPINIGMLKYVSFILTDVSRSAAPDLNWDQRRFVHDRVLRK